MTPSFKKVFLIILDGFGLTSPGPGNPVTLAKMPFLNSLVGRYPAFNIVASGLVVGLPWGKSGNSEVGHSAIGTGRVIVQDWARINGEISSGAFFKNPAFLGAISHSRARKSKLHLVGCVSPGGIHAHEDHLIALLELAAREKCPSVFVHMITDGEDVPPYESVNSLKRLQTALRKANATIATVNGRIFGMDRVLNWDLTRQVWEAMVDGKGEKIEDPEWYLRDCHQKKIPDDQIPPAVVVKDGKPVTIVEDGDSLIFFNYRNDRAKQMITPFVIPAFKEFPKSRTLKNLFVASMTRYSSQLPVHAVAYEAADVKKTLGEVISHEAGPQFRVAEKEKESHITNFFDGGRVEPYPKTEELVVSSRPLSGDEYLKHPEMSAGKIVDELISRAGSKYALYLANFANSDMMAHTGNIAATVKGLEVIDKSLEKIVTKVLEDKHTAVVITCDHGNCEELLDPASGGPDTQHSTNNVFAIFAGQGLETEKTDKNLEALANDNPAGSLIDIAPSVLHLLGLPKPEQMTGSTLI